MRMPLTPETRSCIATPFPANDTDSSTPRFPRTERHENHEGSTIS